MDFLAAAGSPVLPSPASGSCVFATAAGFVPGDGSDLPAGEPVLSLVGDAGFVAGFVAALVLLRTFDEDEKESIQAMLQLSRRKK